MAEVNKASQEIRFFFQYVIITILFIVNNVNYNYFVNYDYSIIVKSVKCMK